MIAVGRYVDFGECMAVLDLRAIRTARRLFDRASSDPASVAVQIVEHERRDDLAIAFAAAADIDVPGAVAVCMSLEGHGLLERVGRQWDLAA